MKIVIVGCGYKRKKRKFCRRNPCAEGQIYNYPILGPFRKQTGSVVPTPQFQGIAPKRARRNIMAAFTLKDDEDVVFTLGWKDKKGNPTSAPPGAVVVWAVANTDVLAIAPSADGMSCTVSAVGPLTTASNPDVLSAVASDANGNPLAAGTAEITVESSAPTTVDLVPGTPTKQS